MKYKQHVGMCIDGSLMVITPLYGELTDSALDAVQGYKIRVVVEPREPMAHAIEHWTLPTARLFSANFLENSNIEILGDL